MDLLASTPIPCNAQETAVVTSLSCTSAYIAVALTNATVHVFSSQDGSHILSLNDPCGEIVWAVAVVDENIVVGSSDGALRIWRVNENALPQPIAPPIPPSRPSKLLQIYLLHVLSTPQSSSILVCTVDDTIRQWATGSATYLNSFNNGHKRDVAQIRSFDNDTKFISAGYEGSICAWDASSGCPIWKVEMEIEAFGLAIGGAGVAVGKKDGAVRILGIENGTNIALFNGHIKIVNGLVFHRDRLISTSPDGYAKVWECSSTNTYHLERSTQLYDHAIMQRCMVGPWSITGGTKGGAADNACGLDCCVKAWKIDGLDIGLVKELGLPVEMVWEVMPLDETGRVAVVLRKRGRKYGG